MSTHNGGRRRKRQRQAARREQRQRRQQRADQLHRDRPSSRPRPPGGRCASAEKLSVPEAARRFAAFLASVPGPLFIGRGDIRVLDEMTDRVNDADGEFLAAVVPAGHWGESPAPAFAMIGTRNPCRSPRTCPNDHRADTAALLSFARMAAASPRPIVASEAWGGAIIEVLRRE
jgi:hypothetical protein